LGPLEKEVNPGELKDMYPRQKNKKNRRGERGNTKKKAKQKIM